MGRPRGKQQYGEVKVAGLANFNRELKKAAGQPAQQAMMKRANERVARLVIKGAQKEAAPLGKMQRKAAATLVPASAANAVRVTGGDRTVPYFGGANFGAYRDRTRLIKARGVGGMRGRRGRATMVRRGEDIDKVARRVESQYVRRGKTVTAAEGGKQVKLQRTAAGGIMKMQGWNQFRKWRKNRDYFLYKAVHKNERKISAAYLEELDRVADQAFPS